MGDGARREDSRRTATGVAFTSGRTLREEDKYM